MLVAVETLGVHTLKVPGQGQSQSDTFEIQLIIGGLPSCDQHNRLRSIASRRMDNAVCVFSPVGDAGGGVLVLLCRNFQACSLQYRMHFVVHPVRSSAYDSTCKSSPLNVRWSQPCLIPLTILSALVQQPLQLFLVSTEYILLTSGEVCMDLAWQERILGDVGFAGVVVQGEEKEPDHTNHNTEEGE